MRTLITIGLSLIWLCLMSFAALSMADPEWLEEYARQGKDAETRAYKDYGDVALHQGEYRLAMAQYQKALQLSPGRASVMVNLAVAYRQAGALEQSRQILNQAAGLPTNRAGLIEFNLGELDELEGHSEQARMRYEKAIGSIVAQDLVFQKLGMIHVAAERYDAALTAFEQIYAVQTDPAAPYLEMLRREQDVYENDSLHRPIVDNLRAIGWTDDHAERYDLDIIQQLQGENKEIAKTCNYLGMIQIKMDQFDKADEQFDRSLAIWPGNQDALRGLQLASRGTREQGEALSNR